MGESLHYDFHGKEWVGLANLNNLGSGTQGLSPMVWDLALGQLRQVLVAHNSL